MKLLKCYGKGQRQLFSLPIWLLFLPIFIVACGGSLGKIQPENVDDIITKSQAAIQQARLANAETLSPRQLGLAESYLESAKDAVTAKEGLEAMRLAYDALTQARIAEREAMYKSQEAGLNAIIQRKEAEVSDMQSNLRAQESKLENVRTELQRLDMQKGQLRAEMDRKVREIERDRQKTRQDYNKTQGELNNLQSKLNSTKTEVLKAQNQANEYERQVYQLRRELALSQSMAEESRKSAKAAQAKAAAQAKTYSKQIERLDQSNVFEQREEFMRRKEEEARAYVQRQQVGNMLRTGRTSLTSQEILKGKSVINAWYLAWASRDIDQHLINYALDLEVEQTVIRAQDERRTSLDRQQVVSALSKRINEQWVKTHSEFEADGESIIGTYRLNRLSQSTGNGNLPALYDIWVREVWTHQVNDRWEIYREGWKTYEGVPKYSTVFN